MFVDDSDDERDSFDVERRQIEIFQRKFLSTTFQSSSDDDDEGIIDGTKIPSSSKAKRREKHSFLDISICSSTNSNDDDIEISPVTTKSTKIPREETIRKPTKNEIIETERKMQQLSRCAKFDFQRFFLIVRVFFS